MGGKKGNKGNWEVLNTKIHVETKLMTLNLPESGKLLQGALIKHSELEKYYVCRESIYSFSTQPEL